jgi:RNA polymerase sigma-70 factor (ECF subfamily)
MTVDVERVVQQVLLAIHAKRQTWDTRQPLAAWVWAIARAALADVWLTSAESATPQVRPPL